MRPKTADPIAAETSAVAPATAVSSAPMCHCSLSNLSTTPMMNKSYASVKKPMPEMSTIRH